MSNKFLLLLLFVVLLSSSSLGSTHHPSIVEPVNLGTTVVAIPFDGGVVMGADTRTSVGPNYVSHRGAHKLAVLWTTTGNKNKNNNNNNNNNNHVVVVGRSGSAAATQHLVEAVQRELQARAYRGWSMTTTMTTTRQVAHWLQRAVYDDDESRSGAKGSSSSSSNSVSLVVAGLDNTIEQQTTTPVVFTISPSGALIQEERFAVAGSGSAYVLGYLDDQLAPASSHKSPLLDEKRARALCHQALSLAMNRDGSSGGFCRIVVVTAQEGCREYTLPPTTTTTTTSVPGGPEVSTLPGFAPASEK